MATLKYENLHKNSTDLKKCYVGFTVISEDGTRTRRKEYGKKNYSISITKGKTEKDKLALLDILYEMVKANLDEGIDPLKAKEARDKKNAEKFKANKEAEGKEVKISIEAGIQIMKEAKGWVNPDGQRKRSSISIVTFLNVRFRKI